VLIKFFLSPLSWIYGFITFIRNKMYDKRLLNVYETPLKTIVIGNLQVGGAGKTPMTAFLYQWLSKSYKTAILSRGYGRETQGLIEAASDATPETIGDEPLWYKQAFPSARVVVAEKRKKGLQYLENTDTELVLLDDAYQHRAIKAQIYLMLTDHRKPYYKDYPLPMGRLREYRTGDKRADVIIVTKCPSTMDLPEKVDIIQHINPYDHQHIFFTSIKPGKPYNLKGRAEFGDIRYTRIIALSGIANPESFIGLCKQFNRIVTPVNYKDHYHYTASDIKRLEAMMETDTILITTEKDAVKLKEHKLYEYIPEDRFFVMPVEVYFLFGDEPVFKRLILDMLYSDMG
jgi:tetraacyldisaccharide 4'-kinase